MKRFLILMVAGLLVFTGCGEKKKFIEGNLELGQEALKMVDKYLDGEIDAEELEDQMYTIGEKIVGGPESMKEYAVNGHLEGVVYQIESMARKLQLVTDKPVWTEDGTPVWFKAEDYNILQERNFLAGIIGEEERKE